MNTTRLNQTLHKAHRAKLTTDLLRAAALAVAVLCGAVLAAVLIDAAFGLATAALIVSNAAIVGLAMFGVVFIVRTALRNRFDARRIARYIEDRAGDGGSHLINAVDFSHPSDDAPPMSDALRAMAVDSGEQFASTVKPGRLVDRGPARRALVIGIGAILVAVLLGLIAPRLFAMVLPRFLDPTGDHPPFTLIDFDVKINPDRVYRGHPATIVATLGGPIAIEEATVVFVPLEGESGQPQRLPMVRRGEAEYELPIRSAESDRAFYIETPHGRSKRHTLTVLPVPTFEDVTVRFDYPAYTKWPARVGPLDDSGIEALAGTRVTVTIDSNLPLKSGALAVSPHTENPADEATIALSPAPSSQQRVAGSFELTHSGVFALSLTAIDGTPSDATPGGPLIALPDEAPRIQMLKPDLRVMAPETWKLDTSFALADDVGVDRAVLYVRINERSLKPIEMPLERAGAARATADYKLDLSAIGAQAGDTIKGHATVYDNRPGGANSTDSATFEVRVITHEEYAEIERQKYHIDDLNAELEAQEAKLDELEELRDELLKDAEALKQQLEKAGDSASEADQRAAAEAEQALKEKLDAFAEKSEQLAEEMEKRAEQPDIYEFEKSAMEQMKKEAEQLREQAANAGKHREGMKPATPPKLDELKKDLQRDGDAAESNAQQREDMQQDLDKLAQLDAMLAEAAEIIRIAEQQRDLADRLGSIRGNDALDPAHVEQMQRMAEEQLQLAEDLDTALDNLLAAAESAREDLPKASASAEDLVKAIRLDLNVRLDQTNAVLGARLVDAPDAHHHADIAATKLESLIAECKANASGEAGMSDLDGALSLSRGQLSKMLGQMAQGRSQQGQQPGQGQSRGQGTGGGDGKSYTVPQRGASDSVTDGKRGGDAFNRADGQNPEATTAGAQRLDPTQRDATRNAPGDVDSAPPRYRELVDDYFKRLADDSR